MENPLLVLSRFRYPGLVKASPTFCSDSKRKKEMRQSLCEEMLLELTSGKCALIPFPFVFKNESNFDCAGNIRVASKVTKEFHTKDAKSTSQESGHLNLTITYPRKSLLFLVLLLFLICFSF